ncbi:hypothetical protein GCM10027568_36050 [Humibacter soli]
MLLCRFGHVATTGSLIAAGMSRGEVARLAADPGVWHPRRGTLACSHLDGDARLAVQLGARLDCVSVLREKGIWIGDDQRLHLRLPPSGRLAQPELLPKNACVHWSSRASGNDRLRTSVPAALRQAMSCLPVDDVIAALESAVYRKAISFRQFEKLIAESPDRIRPVLGEADPRAQSGYETHARLRMRRAGHRVEPQVFVPGAGRVDNVIDDLVDLETDGRKFHAETFAEDRRRDMACEWFGLRVLRVPATLVLTDWDYIGETVERMLEQGPRFHHW